LSLVVAKIQPEQVASFLGQKINVNEGNVCRQQVLIEAPGIVYRNFCAQMESEVGVKIPWITSVKRKHLRYLYKDFLKGDKIHHLKNILPAQEFQLFSPSSRVRVITA
jgi:hypothetical protein